MRTGTPFRLKAICFYSWSPESTYIQRPPYFDNFSVAVAPLSDIRNARVLVLLGDSDHDRPYLARPGNIAVNSPAGQYLLARGVRKRGLQPVPARGAATIR